MVVKLNSYYRSLITAVARIPAPGWLDRTFDILLWVELGLISGLISAPDRPDMVAYAQANGGTVILLLFSISFCLTLIRVAKRLNRSELP